MNLYKSFDKYQKLEEVSDTCNFLIAIKLKAISQVRISYYFY